MLVYVNLVSNRRKIMFGVYTAQTSEQIKMVRQAVDDWLSRHPEDKVIQRAGPTVGAWLAALYGGELL